MDGLGVCVEGGGPADGSMDVSRGSFKSVNDVTLTQIFTFHKTDVSILVTFVSTSYKICRIEHVVL
jgi:hypothetical protein